MAPILPFTSVRLAGPLLLLLVLPVLTGMAVRHRWPALTRWHGRALLGLSVAALAALLAFVIVQEAEHFANALADTAGVSVLFTALAFGAGWSAAWAGRAEPSGGFMVGLVFVVRNVALATAIAVTALGRVEFAVLATAYFLPQVPVLLAGAFGFRRRSVPRGGYATGAEPS